MAEYFEREALEKRLNERLTYLLDKNGPYDHFTDGYDEAVSTVDEFPTADVAPVVYGLWVTHYRSGTPVVEGYVSTCCDMWNNRKSDYCPHCGARMDGGADHDT